MSKLIQRKHILVVGGRMEICKHLHRLGARISLLNFQAKLSSMLNVGIFDRIIGIPREASVDLWIEFASVINEIDPISAVCPINEMAEEHAASIAKSINLQGHDIQLVRNTRDKFQFRKILKDTNAQDTQAIIADNSSVIEEFSKNIGYPLILKPTHGRGSAGVHRIENSSEIKEAYTRSQRACNNGSSVMVEKAFSGLEVAVDFYTVAEEHYFVAISSSETDKNLLPIGSLIPANISVEDRDLVTKKTKHILEQLGVKSGPTHTQFILTSEGPMVIETQLRLPGGLICELITKVTGVDMKEVWSRDLLGEDVRPTLRDMSYNEKCFAATDLHSTNRYLVRIHKKDER